MEKKKGLNRIEKEKSLKGRESPWEDVIYALLNSQVAGGQCVWHRNSYNPQMSIFLIVGYFKEEEVKGGQHSSSQCFLFRNN